MIRDPLFHQRVVSPYFSLKCSILAESDNTQTMERIRYLSSWGLWNTSRSKLHLLIGDPECILDQKFIWNSVFRGSKFVVIEIDGIYDEQIKCSMVRSFKCGRVHGRGKIINGGIGHILKTFKIQISHMCNKVFISYKYSLLKTWLLLQWDMHTNSE